MEPKIYFERESPDYNFGLWRKPERIAANRVVTCILTEFGIMNDRRMTTREYSSFIETQQIVTYSKMLYNGTIKEDQKVFMKTIPICFITLPNDVDHSKMLSSIECAA
jgi:hypothetical protein